jgi:outer membrane receptor protein involved in Fe transport
LLGTASSIAEQVNQYRFTQEVRLASTSAGWLDWTLGGYYTRERDLIAQNLGLNDPTSGQLVAGGLELVSLPEFYREFAGFANGTIHFSPQFDLSLGGRYSHNTQSSAEVVGGALVPGGEAFAGNSSDGVFTYSVAPAYHLTTDTTIYARIARGYRPGGPNVIPALAPASVPREFGSDTTTNYEIGLKSDLIRHVLSVDLTGFIIDWNQIQLLTAVSGFGVNVNGGTASSKGVEFSSTLTPAKGLSLSANGAYIDAKLTQDVVGHARRRISAKSWERLRRPRRIELALYRRARIRL